jgi:spermidine/putrescine transport system permease protein
MISEIKQSNGLAIWLRRRPTLQGVMLVGPAGVWLLLFLVLPLLLVLLYSFWTHKPGGVVELTLTLENYVRFFDRGIYRQILLRSFVAGLQTTALALILSYPTAYYLARRRSGSTTLIFLILVPFWTSYLIRIFSWMLILMERGVFNSVLMGLGIISQPARLLFTPFAVIIGMTYSALPFMILPIYAVLRGIDPDLVQAAKTLGANDRQAFVEVTLPLSMPGVMAGSVIVFIQGAGNFLAPAILGGAGADLMANVIANRFLETFNWPFGSALSIVFLVSMLLFLLIVSKYVAVENIYGPRK